MSDVSMFLVTKVPSVTEAEVYAEIRKEYPQFPVGFQFAIAMQMMQEAGERLARQRDERNRVH